MDGSSLVERTQRALEAREEVLFAYLFGSRASGRTHLHSDVDVAVYIEPRSLDRLDRAAPWGYLAEVSGRLMEALETDDLNVVILNHAPPLLADRVARNGHLLLSRDESRRQRWIVDTKSRYCDLAFLRRHLLHALAERVRTGRFGART